MTNWQPISTAPKDSTSRLVWVPENQCIYCVSWRRNYDDPGYPSGWIVFGGGWLDVLQRATHWSPLPEPPTS